MENVVTGISWQFLLLATGCGAFGQLIRALLGLYKIHENVKQGTIKEEFVWQRFALSIAIGAMMGILTSFAFTTPVAGTDLLVIVGAGYLGADAIEGVLKKYIAQMG